MDAILGNPSSRRPLYIMIGQQVDIYFNLLENDAVSTNYAGMTWRFSLRKYAGARQSKDIFYLTLGNGLSYETYSDVVLHAHMTATQTTIEEGEYYWKLERTDIQKTVIDGVCYATFETK